MLVVCKFLQLSSVFSESQLVLAFLRQKPVLSPALRQAHGSESSPGDAALCQWPPATSLRAITNRAEAGACSEPPQGPGLECWLQSPAHNKLRNQPGAQFCLPGAHATTPGHRRQAGLRHPTRPVSSPLPLPRPVTSHQVSLGEPQSQSLQLRPSPPAVPVGTSVWSHAVDSSVACPTYRSAHLTKTQPLLPLATSPKRPRRSHFRLKSPGGHLRLPPPPLPLALPLNQNHQKPSSAPHATHPQRPPFSREGFSLFPCRLRLVSLWPKHILLVPLGPIFDPCQQLIVIGLRSLSRRKEPGVKTQTQGRAALTPDTRELHCKAQGLPDSLTDPPVNLPTSLLGHCGHCWDKHRNKEEPAESLRSPRSVRETEEQTSSTGHGQKAWPSREGTAASLLQAQ